MKKKSTKKDPKILLLDIMDSIENIQKYTKDVSKTKFFADLKTQDAVIRRIGVIGEAVKNLPVIFRNKNPDILWKEIAGTRNVIIHDYSGIDTNLVWEIIKTDIPELKRRITKILDSI